MTYLPFTKQFGKQYCTAGNGGQGMDTYLLDPLPAPPPPAPLRLPPGSVVADAGHGAAAGASSPPAGSHSTIVAGETGHEHIAPDDTGW